MPNDEVTLAVLRKIEHVPNQRSLADELGVSVGKANYIIKALMDKGFIKAENFIRSESKAKYRYLLTPKGIEEKLELTKRFITRKKAEYEELQSELEEDILYAQEKAYSRDILNSDS